MVDKSATLREPVTVWAATRSCFFRLLQGVEMLHIADKTFASHLFTGTGKFASSQLMVESIRASGSQLVTLAMKRVDLRQHNDAILEPLIAAVSSVSSWGFVISPEQILQTAKACFPCCFPYCKLLFAGVSTFFNNQTSSFHWAQTTAKIFKRGSVTFNPAFFNALLLSVMRI